MTFFVRGCVLGRVKSIQVNLNKSQKVLNKSQALVFHYQKSGH